MLMSHLPTCINSLKSVALKTQLLVTILPIRKKWLVGKKWIDLEVKVPTEACDDNYFTAIEHLPLPPYLRNVNVRRYSGTCPEVLLSLSSNDYVSSQSNIRIYIANNSGKRSLVYSSSYAWVVQMSTMHIAFLSYTRVYIASFRN